MRAPIPSSAKWHKSSYSLPDNDCVEIVRLHTRVGIRDSKRADGPELVVPVDAFTRLVAHVAA